MPVDAPSRSRRRRRSLSEDEEAPMSSWKLGVVIGVIVLCFGMLYPSMFHPMISSLFARPPPVQQHSPTRPPIHPSMSSPRSRPEMHPGMRMAAAQAETASPSSSKGMFAWMLPLYTVGVVAFLIYTLLKSKKKKQRRRRGAYSSSESDDDDELAGGRDVALNIGKKKLRGLQERLKQTELAMGQILEQLGTISAETGQPTNSSGDGPPSVAQQGPTEQQPQIDKDQYLRDLEKALREFKELSNSYNKEERRRRGESVSDEDEGDEEEDDGCLDEEESVHDEDESSEEENVPQQSELASSSARREEVPSKVRRRARRTRPPYVLLGNYFKAAAD